MGGCVGVAGEVDDPVEEVASEVPPGLTAPRCVAFQWEPDGKYLCYSRPGKEEGAVADGLLQLDGEDVTSPHTRFFLEPSKEHDGRRLLHVRCCYDNKYLAAVQGPHDGSGGAWIVGATDEAEEDLSKATCTLFKSIASERRPGYLRFVHAHLGMYACMSKQTLRLSLQEGDGLDAAGGDGDIIIHDLSRSLVLPRYLAFKGDNGMYLRPRIIGRHEYLQFSAGAVDQSLVNTVHGNQDGTFRVWSNHFGKFWRRSPNWIWCDSDGATAGDVDTLFRATRFGSSVALQNLGNNWYCKRLSTEGKNNCLNAGAPTITADARLRLEEAVVSREIYDVVFDLSGPRVYGKTSVVGMATASALNDSASSSTAELTLDCRHMERRTWVSSVRVSLGVTAKIHSGVPHIAAGGKVEVAEDELSGSYSWGSSMEKETRKDVAYQVTVPPKTRVTVTMVATRASCDVPFSYKQRDTLIDGQQITHDMNDGIYTGENFFDFEYVIANQEMI